MKGLVQQNRKIRMPRSTYNHCPESTAPCHCSNSLRSTWPWPGAQTSYSLVDLGCDMRIPERWCHGALSALKPSIAQQKPCISTPFWITPFFEISECSSKRQLQQASMAFPETDGKAMDQACRSKISWSCVSTAHARLFEVAAAHVVPQNPIGAKDLLDREGNVRKGRNKASKAFWTECWATRREKNDQNGSLSTQQIKVIDQKHIKAPSIATTQ